MKTSQKELAQLIVEACDSFKLEHVVISPGSRNAPLIIGFTNHPSIKTYSIVDERCAGFFALGIAQQIQKPVVLVCTSGSALLNYYPAVAEAFYSRLPLVVISADRPRHLVDVGDGQTIRQTNVFENHSLANVSLEEGKEFEAENALKIFDTLKNAILKSGPVHINVPFNEPLYEETDSLSIDPLPKITTPIRDLVPTHIEKFANSWNNSTKKIVLVGAHFPDTLLQEQLSNLVLDESVLILTETTSNLHHQKFINSIDKLIFSMSNEDFRNLQPEILLTLGGMVVSKKIKQFLRSFQPKIHWHVDPYWGFDTYQCLEHHCANKATDFFTIFSKFTKPKTSDYQKKWLTIRNNQDKEYSAYLNTAVFSDLKVFEQLLKRIPDNYQLQLANSSVIRYAQLFDINKTVKVFCNRGTSGIDGSTSTAIGAASAVQEPTVFITGDISFFYDSNALWNNYIKNSFRIILINNEGGGIFRILEGPDESNALDYFETRHHLTAAQLCKMYHFEYDVVRDENELINVLENFYKPSENPRLLEVSTPSEINHKVLKTYFQSP